MPTEHATPKTEPDLGPGGAAVLTPLEHLALALANACEARARADELVQSLIALARIAAPGRVVMRADVDRLWAKADADADAVCSFAVEVANGLSAADGAGL